MASSPANAQMAELFDFAEAAMPDAPVAVAETSQDLSQEPLLRSSFAPAACQEGHSPSSHDLASGLELDEVDAAHAAIGTSVNDWWTKDFSDYLPRYSKPDVACEYCRSRHLDCFYTFDGQKTCSPCNALFRTCSFARERNAESHHPQAIDTLQTLAEDVEAPFGGLTGIRTLKSKHAGRFERPSTPKEDDAERAMKRTGIRFSRATLKILKDWIDDHRDNPYPTDEEKEQLKSQTGLTTSQLLNWFANTRRRDRTRSIRRGVSPSVRPTQPITIADGRRWDTLDPMERWKHSPPENEPAPLSAIANAVRDFSPPPSSSRTESFRESRHQDSRSSGGCSSSFHKKALSITSMETGQSASAFSSGSVSSAVFSQGSFGSFGSFGSSQAKERRRRRRPHPRPARPDADKTRIFQCTFCTDRFKSKYDWSRHEKSLHLSLEKWICAPSATAITVTPDGQNKCTYCDVLEPTKEHLYSHNHNACEEKGLASRTFYRKDHLRQHLRLMHNCTMTESMESWKTEPTYIRSRCGFCGTNFTKWQDRMDHLAKEFRSGRQMKDWKGCRGFDADVTALVTNAMPPYLIAGEAKSPFPFSASNAASMTTHHQWSETASLVRSTSGSGSPTQDNTANTTHNSAGNTPNAIGPALHTTCWAILTINLGQYVQEKLAENITPTDSMLQREARRILYEDPDDTWNQTAADNPEWLRLFKKAHGIGGFQENFSVADAIEDLGITARIPLNESEMTLQSSLSAEIWKVMKELPSTSTDYSSAWSRTEAMPAIAGPPLGVDTTPEGNWALPASNDPFKDAIATPSLRLSNTPSLSWTEQTPPASLGMGSADFAFDTAVTTQSMDLGDLDAPFAWDEGFNNIPISSAPETEGPPSASGVVNEDPWNILTGEWAQSLPQSRSQCIKNFCSSSTSANIP